MISRCRALLLAAAFAVAGPACAGALELTQHTVGSNRVLLLGGAFKMGDAKRFQKAMQAVQRIDEIWLDSPGGSVPDGLEIGRSIRRAGLATRVPPHGECASACAYAFLGGVFRTVDGRIGVHMTTLMHNPELIAGVILLIRSKGVAGAMGIVAFIEQTAAQIMAAQAKYLVEMSVSLDLMTPIAGTDPEDIHWLSPAELRKYNVVNQ